MDEIIQGILGSEEFVIRGDTNGNMGKDTQDYDRVNGGLLIGMHGFGEKNEAIPYESVIT